MSGDDEASALARPVSRRSRHRHKDESPSDSADRPSGGKLKAFNAEGMPKIKNKPTMIKYLRAGVNDYCGSYMFLDTMYVGFDVEQYYEDNKEQAWAIVASTEVCSDATAFALTGSVELPAGHKVVMMTPISSLWQSQCGRFFLYPEPSEFTFTDDESLAKDFWFPQAKLKWKEYITTAADPRSSYNSRNGK